jgi:hypothetical protein
MAFTGIALLCIYNYTVFVISMFALIATLRFCHTTADITLPFAPKATAELHKVYIPPMSNMQIFVFLFDFCVALYYTTQWPIWDNLKKKLPLF